MKIVVVGGVAGGMSAAARTRRMDEHAEIVVLERDPYVSFANCGLPYHIGGVIEDRDALLLQTPESLGANLNLDVRTGHEVTALDRGNKTVTVHDHHGDRTYEESYDWLVLSPGASPIRPPIPGVDHPRIHVLRNVPDMDRVIADLDAGASRAVVVGGSYIGLEVAEAFVERGLRTTIVEMADQLLPILDHEMARDLQYHVESHGVDLHLGQPATSFDDAGGAVVVELADGVRIDTDVVLLATGVRPDAHLAADAGLRLGPLGGVHVDERMRTSDPHVLATGDAVETPDALTDEGVLLALAGPANRQGRIAADTITATGSGPYRASWGTAVVKVFEMTAGGTGATEADLDGKGVPHAKVYLHPSGHASYYPGTAPMHLKVLFRPDDGRLLGAQVVGYDGVDKRIDVLATALQAGLTVFDLEHLELAYAPPYGSAKDPVNMAGFLGANLLRGDLHLWYPEDFPERTLHVTLLDVRTPLEHETWHIPGSVNIPLPELRGRLAEVPRDRPVYTYCRSGFRSYLAYRILRQRGFDEVANLAGGTLTFQSFHRGPLSTGRPGVPVVTYAEDKLLGEPGALEHA